MTYINKEDREKLIAAGLVSYPEGGEPAKPIRGKTGVLRRTIGALGRAGDPPKTLEQVNATLAPVPTPPDVSRYRVLEELVAKKLEGYIAELEADKVAFVAQFADGLVPTGIRTGYDRAIGVLRAKLPPR